MCHTRESVRLTSGLIVLVTISCGGVSCGGPPDVYAPPTPRKPVDVFGTDSMSSWTAMGSSDAATYIVRDIGSDVQAEAWRWALEHPEMRFFLKSASGWKAKVDYSIAQSLLEKTGPLTLTFLVNNTPIDSVRHDHDGRFTWEKPVPESALMAGGFNYLRIEPDKTAVEATGRPISFILTAAGFVR